MDPSLNQLVMSPSSGLPDLLAHYQGLVIQNRLRFTQTLARLPIHQWALTSVAPGVTMGCISSAARHFRVSHQPGHLAQAPGDDPLVHSVRPQCELCRIDAELVAINQQMGQEIASLFDPSPLDELLDSEMAE
jgi:hypothetical protein